MVVYRKIGVPRASYIFVYILFLIFSKPALATLAAGPENIISREVIEKSIFALERERWRALTESDSDTLKSLLGRNYYHIDSGGRLRSKTEFLQAIERGDFAHLKFSPSNHEIEVEGSVAIIRGLCSVEQQLNPSADKNVLRYVRVWQLISGRWVNTMHQTTRVKAAPDAREHGML